MTIGRKDGSNVKISEKGEWKERSWYKKENKWGYKACVWCIIYGEKPSIFSVIDS